MAVYSDSADMTPYIANCGKALSDNNCVDLLTLDISVSFLVALLRNTGKEYCQSTWLYVL